MVERWEHPENIPDGIDYYDSDEELVAALEKISSSIGWIVIEFNSLEDAVVYCTKEILSTSLSGDTLVYALMANMGFSAKANGLINIYGELVEKYELHDLREPLKVLDARLKESARRRNCYAHADWAGISRQHLVAVKISANRRGIRQLYRTFEPEDMDRDLAYIRETTKALENFDEAFNQRINDGLP